ncbi:MAG: glycosyltransferase [Patescibacteria group bacterium]
MPPKLLLVGGGTGGHAGPIIALYNQLIKDDSDMDITIVGSGTPEEMYFYKDLKNYLVIKSGKLHRYLTTKNIIELSKAIIGFAQSISLLRKIKPDYVFSKGGHVSLPIVRAAILLNIPYSIHESDISIGKTNLVFSKKADKVFVCYPLKYFPQVKKEKLVQSGPILREGYEIGKTGEKKHFGFKDDKPVLLLTGGSQGSLKLSETFIEIVPKLLKDFNIIHQAGKHSIEISREFKSKLTEEEKRGYYLTEMLSKIDSIDYMSEALDLANIVITRAGSTILEVAVKSKPMIIIPWKDAAQNHQDKNAEYFATNKAAIIIKENELRSETLLKTVEDLWKDEEEREKIITNISKLFPNNGVKIVAREIIERLKAGK